MRQKQHLVFLQMVLHYVDEVWPLVRVKAVDHVVEQKERAVLVEMRCRCNENRQAETVQLRFAQILVRRVDPSAVKKDLKDNRSILVRQQFHLWRSQAGSV